ncbi:MAG: hypothetical protein N3I35_10250 [Clostridia bacterium]|nr:hypothetical protein [Clostridia bacterium]
MLDTIIKNDYLIPEIDPFVDVWYKDCFHSSLFPIINHFVGNINPFLIKDVFLYNTENGEDLPLINFKSKQIEERKLIYEILDEMGISCKARIVSSDLINDLVEVINNNKPAIIGVDCFYESIRADAYNKEHVAHSLLVYGFNRGEMCFNIIEHSFRFSIDFKPKTITFSDLINSYNGFLENLNDYKFTKDRLPSICRINGIFPSFYEFARGDNLQSAGTSLNDTKYISKYANYMLNNKDMFSDSVESIKTFTEEFQSVISGNLFLSGDTNQFLDNLNNVINNKKAEKYVFCKVFGSQAGIVECFDNVINDWTSIRAFLAKYVYSTIYNKTHMDNCFSKLENIYNQEKQYYDMLFSLMKTIV